MSTEPAPTPKFELGLLAKLLNMTTATEDTVALVAIRKANAELSKLGKSWDDLLRGKITVVADPFNSIPDIPRRHDDTAPLRATGGKAATPPFRPPPYQAPPPRPTPRPAPPPRPAPTPYKFVGNTKFEPNQFGARCLSCNTYADPQKGWRFRTNGKWYVMCDTCFNATANIASTAASI